MDKRWDKVCDKSGGQSLLKGIKRCDRSGKHRKARRKSDKRVSEGFVTVLGNGGKDRYRCWFTGSSL